MTINISFNLTSANLIFNNAYTPCVCRNQCGRNAFSAVSTTSQQTPTRAGAFPAHTSAAKSYCSETSVSSTVTQFLSIDLTGLPVTLSKRQPAPSAIPYKKKPLVSH